MRAAATLIILACIIITLLFWAGIFFYETWLQVQANTKGIALIRETPQPLIQNKWGSIYVHGEPIEGP